jgi:hypothetical protein
MLFDVRMDHASCCQAEDLLEILPRSSEAPANRDAF